MPIAEAFCTNTIITVSPTTRPWVNKDYTYIGSSSANSFIINGFQTSSLGYNYVDLSFTSVTSSSELRANTFNFSLPGGSNIDGVELILVKPALPELIQGSLIDENIRMIIGGVVSGDNKASPLPWPNPYGLFTYGSPTDLWGNSLSRNDINNTLFGFTIKVKIDPSRIGELENTRGVINQLLCKVYYT